MNYSDYILTGNKLIKYVISQNSFTYNNSDYSSNEWRYCSIEGEKWFLSSLEQSWYYYLDKSKSTNDYKNYIEKENWFRLIIPTSSRSWFDFAIILDNYFYPINIKITQNNWKVSNLFWVKVLDYLLFYNYIEENNIHFIKKRNEEAIALDIKKSLIDIKNNRLEVDLRYYNLDKIRDYFFLVIDKDTSKSKVYPFLNIKEQDIIVNPKNAFQINFHTLEDEITSDLDLWQNIQKLVNLYYNYVSKKAIPFMILNWFDLSNLDL